MPEFIRLCVSNKFVVQVLICKCDLAYIYLLRFGYIVVNGFNSWMFEEKATKMKELRHYTYVQANTLDGTLFCSDDEHNNPGDYIYYLPIWTCILCINV